MLIYQEDIGAENSGKKPNGGVISWWTLASSMSVVVANPITIYGNAVIGQTGQSGDLYNYYWTSYTRGVDGKSSAGQGNDSNWHNLYLDSYIPLRYKSIYDPCPYGYRIPSNGTYNQFNSNPGWTSGSYQGGTSWNQIWFSAIGSRRHVYSYAGASIEILTSTCVSNTSGYGYWLIYGRYICNTWSSRAYAQSVRCIEECELLPDATEAKASYRQHSGKPEKNTE